MEWMIHSSDGLALAVLMFASAFRNRKLARPGLTAK